MSMLVEYSRTPLAIATRTPRFSWEVPLAGRWRSQSAYQILVASSVDLLKPGRADLWDSGRVASPQSVNIEYAGAALRSNMDCWCSVQIWDESGEVAGFSEPAYFGTALLEQSDWSAQWIGMCSPDEPIPDPDCFQLNRVPPEVAAFDPDPRAPMMRREFALAKAVRRARAFVAGLGLFELRLNGTKVGEDVLTTPRTAFRKRLLYSTYDVTAQLTSGKNALGILLGNGWYNGQQKYWGWQMQWHGSPRAIVQMEIEFEDGSSRRVVSDPSWLGAWSPITFNCLFDGEEYDARLEQPGWDSPDFDDSSWQAVNRVPAPGGKLCATSHEPEQVVETLRPVSVSRPQAGVCVFDVSKNITGWIRLRIRGGKAGDKVTLRFGEAQHEDGSLNASSNNAARQQDGYILKGKSEEVFEPRFTFHGFQFVEISGMPGTPELADLTACFVRTAVAETGSFDCGNDLINTIHRCTLQSQRCNLQMGVPTDDTQRPERQGWGGDAWGAAREALYNLWMPRVYAKWIQDHCDQQDDSGMVGMIVPQAGANEDLVWTAAFVLIPWWQYLHCGDRRILESSYPFLQRYMKFLQKNGRRDVSTMNSQELLAAMQWINGPKTRVSAEEERGHLQRAQWGDHLSTAEGFAGRSNLPLSIASAFYCLDAAHMAEIAAVLDKPGDAAAYRALAEDIKQAFNERFYDPALGYYDTGTQAAQAWPLAFGLVPEENLQRVANYFTRAVGQTQRRLTTGYAGTKFAIEALAMNGRNDIVWQLATLTSYPSWGYMLKHKRSTSCERWDGVGGSLNHAPLGAAIDEWFYWGLAGIRPDKAGPGFEKIQFKPYIPADCPWAAAALRTVRGEVAARWQQQSGEISLTITVPANCTATVHIPTADSGAIREGDGPAAASEGVALLDCGEAESCFETGSGTYCFTFPRV